MSEDKPDKKNHLVGAIFQKDVGAFDSYVCVARTTDGELYVTSAGYQEVILGLIKAGELFIGNELVKKFENEKGSAKREQR